MSGSAIWFFAVGIGCDIGGGVLVAGELILVSPLEISRRRVTFPSLGNPLPKDQDGASMAISGAGLLGLGFILQLCGYVAESGDRWLILVAVLAAFGSLAIGRQVARRAVAPWRHNLAEREVAEQQMRKYEE
jgi:hypothetical protein